MNCPKCEGKTKVLESRLNPTKRIGVRRRRGCQSCGYRFTTVEILMEKDEDFLSTLSPDAIADELRSTLITTLDSAYRKFLTDRQN